MFLLSEDLKEFAECITCYEFAGLQVVVKLSLSEQAGVLSVEQEHHAHTKDVEASQRRFVVRVNVASEE